MTSVRVRPYLSLIGFCLFFVTVMVYTAFQLTTDPGSKMLLSSFSAILILFTLLWGIMGVVEFFTLMKKTNRVKAEYQNERIGREEYRKISSSLTVCYVTNVSYLVIVSFQFWYVISHWDTLNL